MSSSFSSFVPPADAIHIYGVSRWPELDISSTDGANSLLSLLFSSFSISLSLPGANSVCRRGVPNEPPSLFPFMCSSLSPLSLGLFSPQLCLAHRRRPTMRTSGGHTHWLITEKGRRFGYPLLLDSPSHHEEGVTYLTCVHTHFAFPPYILLSLSLSPLSSSSSPVTSSQFFLRTKRELQKAGRVEEA